MQDGLRIGGLPEAAKLDSRLGEGSVLASWLRSHCQHNAVYSSAGFIDQSVVILRVLQ